ncbi:MAG TPA: cache domain-containing protein [Stellaceae bacterium]|nr:cache domain-containing protein [Stellaceae bacterium]
MPGEWRIGARLALLGGIAAVILVAGAAILYSEYSSDLARAQDEAGRLFAERAASADVQIDTLVDHAIDLAGKAPGEKGIGEPVSDNGRAHPALDFLDAAVDSAPSIYAAYYGLADGGFIEVIATHGNPEVLKALGAPDGTVRVIRTVVPEEGHEVTQDWSFLDSAGAVLGERSDPSPAFDPRQTTWYQRALNQDAPVFTRPYVFSSMPVMGVTAVRYLAASHGVFGVDFLLSDLSRFIAEHPVSANGALYIFDNSLDLLAAAPDGPNGVPTGKLMSDMRTLGLPILQRLADLSQGTNINRVTRTRIQGRDYIALVSQWRGRAAPLIDVGVIAPASDFARPLGPVLVWTALATAVVLVAALFVAARLTRQPRGAR